MFTCPTEPEGGFTLLEILISLAVVGILAALAAPALGQFASEQRLGTTMSQLTAELNFARAEAIKRNARVLFCARSATAPACSGRADWQHGWLVCYDANFDDACDAGTATDPNPVRLGPTLRSGLRLTANTALVRFNPVGTSNGAATLTLTGDWAGATVRTGSVATTGAVSSHKE